LKKGIGFIGMPFAVCKVYEKEAFSAREKKSFLVIMEE
jgi:hypothetical protein